MTLRQYLTIMILSTLLCWTAWLFVLVRVDPTQTSAIGLVFFYISFFLSLVGTASLFLFSVYRAMFRDYFPMFRYVQKSFRDAFGIAVVIVAALILQARHIISLSAFIFFLLLTLFLLGCVLIAWYAARRAGSPPAGDISFRPDQ